MSLGVASLHAYWGSTISLPVFLLAGRSDSPEPWKDLDRLLRKKSLDINTPVSVFWGDFGSFLLLPLLGHQTGEEYNPCKIPRVD